MLAAIRLLIFTGMRRNEVLTLRWQDVNTEKAMLSCRLDSIEPRHQAPQARSQDCLQAGWFSSASIGGADKENSETQSWRRHGEKLDIEAVIDLHEVLERRCRIRLAPASGSAPDKTKPGGVPLHLRGEAGVSAEASIAQPAGSSTGSTDGCCALQSVQNRDPPGSVTLTSAATKARVQFAEVAPFRADRCDRFSRPSCLT